METSGGPDTETCLLMNCESGEPLDGPQTAARRGLNEPDELATNCSETMSTEADEDWPGEPVAGRQPAAGQRMQSVKNRAGTPRRSRQVACDEQRQQLEAATCSAANYEPSSDLSELVSIITSGADQLQAPPSYGTATRLCASLDPSQLNELTSGGQQRPATFQLFQQSGCPQVMLPEQQRRDKISASLVAAATTTANPTQADHQRQVGGQIMSNAVAFSPPINHAPISALASMHLNATDRHQQQWPTTNNNNTGTNQYLPPPGALPAGRTAATQEGSQTGQRVQTTTTTSISENQTYNSNANDVAPTDERNPQTLLSTPKRQQSHSYRKRRRHRSTSGQRGTTTTTTTSTAPTQTGLSLTNANYHQRNAQDALGGAFTIDLHHQHHHHHRRDHQQQQVRRSNENNNHEQNKQLYGSSKAAGGEFSAGCRRPGQVGPTINESSPSLPAKTISAHCWLIDSSDEQTSYARAPTNDSNYRGQSGSSSLYATTRRPEPDGGAKKHLTVAVKLQETERNKSNTLNYPRRANQASDQVREFKCNSLRPTDRNSTACRVAPTTTTMIPMDLNEPDQHEARTADWLSEDYLHLGANSTGVKRTPGRSTSLGRPKRGRRQADSPSEVKSGRGSSSGASSVVRLSAVLTFVSNLVKRNAAQAGRSALESPQYDLSQGQPAATNHQHNAQSISGSLAPYTMPSSVGVSSGSSTSAYATGGSSSIFSASTSTQNAAQLGPLVQLNANHPNLQQSMTLTKLKPPIGRPLYLAYSKTAQISHHSYEYCDGPTNNCNGQLVHETQFTGKQGDKNHRPPTSGSSSASDESHSDLMSDISLDSRDQNHEAHQQQQQQQLAQLAAPNLMSDNELIPGETTPAGAPENMPTGQARQQPAPRRRAWRPGGWWALSSLVSRRRRTFAGCGDSSDDQSVSSTRLGLNGRQFANGAQHDQHNQSPAARYRSLRLNGRHRQSGQLNNPEDNNDSNSPLECCASHSTLDNVISLAKADRVFRCRLLASVLVALVLFVLICLLASLIYKRNSRPWQAWPSSTPTSTGFYSNGPNGRLSLLVDDLDSDLSWLWPPAPQLPDQSMSNNQRAPKTSQLDDSIRSLLMAIDQSERLQQFQQSMTHLTNIQLANDNFIDLTQLATLVVVGHDQQMANQSEPDDQASNSTRQRYLANKPTATFGALDHDLVSLTLLSNLHWPLVKWRHQSQQSMAANFLSFAISPSAPTISLGATQTLRSLLSSLLLAESIELTTISSLFPNYTTTSALNLKQFQRLNAALKSTSQQLVACSLYLNEEQQYDDVDSSMQTPLGTNKLKLRFCRLLVGRYKRMMFVLSELNHNHIFELHQQQANDELPVNTHQLNEQPSLDEATTFTMAGQTNTRHQKNLLDFLLDRLALLDVHTLSESILAHEYDNLMESEEEQDTEQDQQQLFLLDVMTNQESVLQLTSKTNQSSQSRASSLIELARNIIGEGPLNLNVNLNKDQESQAKFQQLMRDNYDHWRQVYISNDLINPWPVRNKPSLLSLPLNYDLFLHPNLTTRLILGMVKIDLRVLRPTNFIVLNCHQLNLVELSVWMKQEAGLWPIGQKNQSQQQLKQVPIRRIIKLERQEQILVEFYEPINPTWRPSASRNDNHNIQFTGELPVTLNGSDARSLRYTNQFLINISFNKTSLMDRNVEASHSDFVKSLEFVRYVDYFAQPEAEMKTLLYSQFHAGPRLARQVFPCFDEPHLRATIQLNIVHQQDHQVLFNSQKRERIPYSSDGLLQMSVFESSSMPVATHSVGFLICDAQNIKSIGSRVTTSSQLTSPVRLAATTTSQAKKHHIQVQISAQFELLNQAEFASQLVGQLLGFYQTFLQFDFPADKLDLIVVPKPVDRNNHSTRDDLTSSEIGQNFGLILFKSTAASSMSLLVDANLISQDLLEQISLIVSHQLAQQYFGQIVGLHTWSQDSWLFRALCQYLQSLALSQVQADWHLDEQFQVTSIGHFLQLEQYNTNNEHPISVAAHQPGHLGDDDDDDNDYDQADLFVDQTQQQPVEHIDEQANKRAAILHMLLFNLLPSLESQARFMRRLVVSYKFKTMNSGQFWRQFGHQLVMDSSIDRQTVLSGANYDQFDPHDNQTSIGGNTNERVVFVRRPPPPGGREAGTRHHLQLQEQDIHRVQARPAVSGVASHQIVDNLDLVASSWLGQRGFPLIVAASFRDRLQLHQERFSFAWSSSYDGSEPNATSGDGSTTLRHLDEVEQRDEDNTIWPIPLMFVSKLSPKSARFVWFNQRDLELPLVLGGVSTISMMDSNSNSNNHYSSSGKLPAHYNWFKLNVNQSSPVRVNYDERNWEALSELLLKSHYSNHQLSSLDRANLLDDALTLMRAGKLSVGVAMNLTLYLELGERDFQPWSSALYHLDQMQTLLNQNPLWHRYVLKLLQPISVVIGWKDDGPHLMRKLRRNLFNVALQFGDEKTVGKAKQEFKMWLKSGRFIVPNLQELVYLAGVRYGDQSEWFHCWQRYQQLVAVDQPPSKLMAMESDALAGQKPLGVPVGSSGKSGSGQSTSSNDLVDGTNNEMEKRQLLTALASTQNTWLLEQFLNYSLDSTMIQTQHLRHVVQTLGKNPVARLYLWRFVRLNWLTLMERYGSQQDDPSGQADTGGPSILVTMILESTKHFATKLDYDEVRAFFDLKRKQQQVGQPWQRSIESSIRQSLQVISSNIYWRNNIEPRLTKWLSHYNNNNMNIT